MEVDDKSNLSPGGKARYGNEMSDVLLDETKVSQQWNYEGERKRKVDKQEEKPAKRKSFEYKGEVSEYVVANALQNLTVPDQGGDQKAIADPSPKL
ncbi:hypothetical protein pdam_00019453 [Pocillopora damicornis]|uniref:Uncharacterized protein n=1 Tax=Pocillopora damicornis TaxID=46731 RepID=A0A3M6T5D8_POCDA|nr:hypothetical protein pdam_00019453 [Pocillopora damicornis]